MGIDYFDMNVKLGSVGKLYVQLPWKYQICSTELAKIRERLRLPVGIEPVPGT